MDSNELVLREGRQLVADRLPAGYRIGQSGGLTPTDSGVEDERQFFVLDNLNRRRSYAYSMMALEGLLSEVRRLAVEVRRVDAWKKKSQAGEGDLDRLAMDLCPYLSRSKNTRWGRSEKAAASLGKPVPAGYWWIHESSGLLPAEPRGDVLTYGDDLFFSDAVDFGRYLISLKENRFELKARTKPAAPGQAQAKPRVVGGE